MPLSLTELKELAKGLFKSIEQAQWRSVEAILKNLRDNAEPTEEVIRSTKLGKAIGPLRKSEDAAVAELSKVLVKKWKSIVDAEKERNEGAKAEASRGEVSASPISKKGTPAPATAGTPSTTADSPAPDGSKAAQNGSAMGTPPNLSTPINFEILNDKVRNACLKLLHQSLAVDHEGDKSIVFEAALNVESAAFKVIGKNTPSKEYSTKMRSLSLNVKDKRNPSLRKGVIDGRISPESFVVMTAEEMASDEQKQERQRLIMKNLFNARAAEEQQAETDAFECSRCRQRKCRYYQKQTRSADEPMTVFVTCTNCNYRWKFS